MPQLRRADAPARLTSPDRSGRPLQDHENPTADPWATTVPGYGEEHASLLHHSWRGSSRRSARIGSDWPDAAWCSWPVASIWQPCASAGFNAYARRRCDPVRPGDRRTADRLDVDVLILTTKTQQANDALVTWADAPVHQNALGRLAQQVSGCRSSSRSTASRLRAMAHRFRRVYGICVWTPAVHLAPGGSDHSQHSRSRGCFISAACPTAGDHDQALQQVSLPIWWPANFDDPHPRT